MSPENALQIEVFPIDVGSHVVLSGELDLATAPQLRECLAELAGGGKSVEVDLSGLQFIDSTGITVLMLARKNLAASGGSLVVLAAASRVLEVFEVTGIATILMAKIKDLANPVSEVPQEPDPI
jgi:anti-sigma B factor antagonist